MKLLMWMQNKLNGGQCNQVANEDVVQPIPTSYYGRRLLTIGTLGIPENQDIRRPVETEALPEEDESSSPDLTEFTPEEVGRLEKKLTKYLKQKTAPPQPVDKGDGGDEQPLDRFLNCLSNLNGEDRTNYSRYRDRVNSSSINIVNDKEDEEYIDRTIRDIIGKCQEVCMESKKKKKGIIGKKFVSFLFKKILLCSSGFNIPEIMQESRMEKLLRTLIISKKMCPQNVSSTKRILEGRYSTMPEKQDDVLTQEQDKRSERFKWIKTDSEYIILDLD